MNNYTADHATPVYTLDFLDQLRAHYYSNLALYSPTWDTLLQKRLQRQRRKKTARPKKFPGPEIPASTLHKWALDLVDCRRDLVSSCMIANLYSEWGLRCAVGHPKVVKSVVVYTGR